MRQAEGVAPLEESPNGRPFQRAGAGSLERSLQWTLGLVVVSLFVAVTGAAVWVSTEAAQQFVASRLSHDADAIVAGLAPQPRQITRPLPPVFSQPFSGHYFVVRFQDGTLLRSRSLWDESLAVHAQPPGETELDRQRGPQGQRLLVWEAGYEKGGQPFTMAVAEDLNPILQALRRLLWTGLALSLLAGVLLLLAQRWLLRRGFRRIDTVRADIQRLAAGEIPRLTEEVPAEVQPLVRELNQLIDGWQQHIERSRNTLGNLAHALKAPLGLILQESANGAGTIAKQAQRMRELIDRALRRGRLAGRGAPARRFRPGRDCQDLAATLKTLYADKPLEIKLDVQSAPSLSLDQEDMLELLGNLLDNAAKWAAHRVHLRLRDDADLRIRIEDDGPGVDKELVDTLLTRGSRLDETRPGHGLGLAIVGDIVRDYGGTLTFERSGALGGLMVTVALPVATCKHRGASLQT
jgi:signal transduction histidine kinase